MNTPPPLPARRIERGPLIAVFVILAAMIVIGVLTLRVVRGLGADADVRAARHEQRATREKADLDALASAHKVQIGMSAEQVRRAWGEPQRLNRTVSSRMTAEQWVYGKRYLYMEDGVLVRYSE